MTIETVICAKCEGRVPLDTDHGSVIITLKRMNDRDLQDDYALCKECVIDVQDEWSDPV